MAYSPAYEVEASFPCVVRPYVSPEHSLVVKRDADSDEERDVPTPDPKDPFYYFSLVTFEVEGRFFRVPRSELELQSEVFGDMFLVPAATNEGGSDEDPIHLPGIQKQTFHDLLVLLYPRRSSLVLSDYRTNRVVSPAAPAYGSSARAVNAAYQYQVEIGQTGMVLRTQICDWSFQRLIAVFELVIMWNFETLKFELIRLLAPVDLWDDVVDQIVFAHKHEIKSWYPAAYEKLANRGHAITVDEGGRLGYAFSLKMEQVREKRIMRESNNTRNNSFGSFGNRIGDTMADLKMTFGI